jgi:hypothetical protein
MRSAAAVVPAVIDGRRREAAALDFARRWLASQWTPRHCR